MLNPAGPNCPRYFPRRGFRVRGARTTSSQAEWKFLNVRRYFDYLERSIELGIQWVVFEPNGESLWQKLEGSTELFLDHEWRQGGLAGEKSEQAFFVRCDRTTMTRNDLDNGRLICAVGVAPLKPTEFIIFRIGQKILDSESRG